MYKTLRYLINVELSSDKNDFAELTFFCRSNFCCKSFHPNLAFNEKTSGKFKKNYFILKLFHRIYS